MFSKKLKLTDKKETPTPIKEISDQKPRPLFNQADILKAHGEEGQAEGLCSPLSNLYAKYRLGLITSEFMEDPEVAYVQAVIEENHQQDLIEQNMDGEHSAFVDSGTPYIIKKVTFNDVSNEEKLNQQIGTKPVDTLINFPVTGSVDHMIYLGRDDKGKGYEYDANRYRQEITAPADNIIRFTANFFKKQAADNKADGRETVTLAIAHRK